MRFQMPPPALGGIVFNLLMLATPVIAFKYFGPPWVIAGLWVAVIGLAWFFSGRAERVGESVRADAEAGTSSSLDA